MELGDLPGGQEREGGVQSWTPSGASPVDCRRVGADRPCHQGQRSRRWKIRLKLCLFCRLVFVFFKLCLPFFLIHLFEFFFKLLISFMYVFYFFLYFFMNLLLMRFRGFV
eukprot:GHVL01000629.1.p2 GENE.GHVL01000629.1~~GHVL01000629.1.p2  ORF type:complete len:110 (-),score=8.88 GHVL01000629.1:157-486(-)